MLIGSDTSTDETPWLTILLIAICTAVFAAQSFLLHDSVARFGVVPGVLTGANPQAYPPQNVGFATLFTSGFMHGNLLHLAGNMFFLWLFGKNVEESFGRTWMILFIAICEVGANISHVMIQSASDIPSVGASGFISGIMGAYLILFPTAKLRLLEWLITGIFSLQLPAWVWLGFWIASQIVLLGTDPNGGIAYAAHVGGFAVGAVVAWTLHRLGVIATYAHYAGVVSQAPTQAERLAAAERSIEGKQRLLLGRLSLVVLAALMLGGSFVFFTVSRNAHLKAFRTAASAGDAHAAFLAANALLWRDEARALDDAMALYEKAASGGDHDARWLITDVYWSGRIGKIDASPYRDRRKSIAMDWETVVAGDEDRLFSVAAAVLAEPEVAGEYLGLVTARLRECSNITAFRDRKQRGFVAYCQGTLALFLARGVGVLRDPQAARTWAERAKENGAWRFVGEVADALRNVEGSDPGRMAPASPSR